MPLHESSGTAVVKKEAWRRARTGMPWIARDELVSYDGDGGAFCDVTDESALVVGTALWDPDAQWAVRLISTAKTRDPLLLLRTRLERADARRRADLLGADAYRLCHGEGDSVPGLFVDRFGTGLVVSTSAPRMQAIFEHLLPALLEVTGATAVALRTGDAARLVRGDERLARFHHGRLLLTADLLAPGTPAITADLENQRALRRWAKGRVLDVAGGVGGYGLQLADAGAREAVFVDADEDRLSRIADDALANGLGGKVQVRKADARTGLAALEAAGERFAVVVLHLPVVDEPADRRDEVARTSFDLARSALKLLDEGGLLVAGTPSVALPDEAFAELVADAAGRSHKRLQAVARFTEGPDHPLLLGAPQPAGSLRFVARVLAEA